MTFVQQTGQKKDANDNTIIYYKCNRSGFYKTKSTGQRQLKSQGTDKINGHCTAFIKTTTNKHNETIKAEICSTHYGHGHDLEHIRLDTNTRLTIARKLCQGVSQQHILDTVRDSIGNDLELKRIHLLTQKDINNIERKYNINTVRRHKNNTISVAFWVDEMAKRGDETNPVILYKPQTVPQPDNCDDLSDDDFLLCIQTPMQASFMKNFGHKRIVCIDSTHCTNSYDFSLVTVLVTDEFGEGYPVGWCLSNREDQLILQQFFSAMKKRVGSIKPMFFMSDDAEQFYNAWQAVFGKADNKLLCTWHVDRAWRNNLKLIKDRKTQITVYHTLRMLLEEANQETFELLLEKTTQQILTKESTTEFGEYFNSYYKDRKKQWAYCYRQSSTINTNMYVEAFHHVLKYIYLKGKVNKHIDNCIHTLLKVSRDKTFHRLIKLTKGKVTKKTTTTHKRHTTSTQMDISLVTPIDNNSWEVQSSDTKRIYEVAVGKKNCHVNCALKCSKCSVCIHAYSCTCDDYIVAANMCKHIHLCVRTKTQTQAKVTEPHRLEQDIHRLEQLQQTHATIVQNTDTSELMKQVLSKVATITTITKQCGKDYMMLTDLNSQLHSLISRFQIQFDKPELLLPTVDNWKPSNKRITTQRSFFSTRKKRKLADTMTKPTKQDKKNIEDKLRSHTPVFLENKSVHGNQPLEYMYMYHFC